MINFSDGNIRPIEFEDLPLLKEWNNAEARGRFQEMELSSLANLEERFRRDGFNSSSYKVLLITYAQKPVGLIYVNFKPTGNDVRVASLGVVICQEEFRGLGLGEVVTNIMVNYLFNNYVIHRIEADTDNENKPARRVLEKCGFTFEGILRGYRFHNGSHRDFALYSILRTD